MNKFFKKIQNYLGLLGIKFVILITKILPINITSFIFGNLAVLICPFIPTTYLVLKNLKYAMPEKNLLERYKIMFGVWYSLGRFAGEYFYIYNMKKNKIFKYVYINEESKRFIEEIKNSKSGNLLFSGHISNWEAGLRALNDCGVKTNVVFRRLNNDLIEPKYSGDLRENVGVKMIAKQDGAGFKMVKALQNKEVVLLLVDQRDGMNGELVDFFGKKAYTNRTLYALAKKMNVPVYGIRVIRRSGFVNFELKIEKIETNNSETEIEFLQKMNNILEKWIREYPEQWFWVHNRWRGNGEFGKLGK